jgi:outer membrane autotransporter protein
MNYHFFRFSIISILAFWSAASPCLAVELEWNDGTGNWFTSGNWTPAGPPTNADWAHIDNGGTAQIATAGAVSNIVELGSAAGDSGTVSVSGVGTLNVPNLFDIGFSGTGTLNITTGGKVTARTTRIGSDVGAIGLLSVDGAGSSYSAPIDSINIALSGHGTMNVTNGGSVTSFSGFIAEDETAVGIVTVNGAGSNWTMSDILVVAYTGSGTLNIQNGGDVTNGEGIIGGAPSVPQPVSATGIVNVTGPGSTWTNNGNLTVGLATGATGTLNISTGGTVSSASAIIADAAGSTGTVNLSIMGATWTIAGNLTVGNSGNGTLHINNNGFVSNSTATIADQVGSVGTVTVSEQWTNSSTLTVGNSGNATLDITGSVTNTNATIANQVGSTGTVTVSQSGAWTNSSDLTIANSGTGTMNITTLGNVTDTSAIIANQIGSTGVANVANGIWTNSSSLTIANSGNGTLNITLAGTISDTAGTIAGQTGSTGIVNVDGAGSAWTNSGGLRVGDSGSGQLHITNGGAVSNTFGNLGANAGSIGTATIDGTGSVWTNNGTLSVGSLGTGSMTITNGGAVHTNQSMIGSGPTGNGTGIVDGANSIWTTSSLFVGGDPTGPMGTGLVRILNGGTVSSGNATVWSSGTLEIGINPHLVAPLTFDGGTLRTIADTTFINGATLATGGVIIDSNGFTSTLTGIFVGPGGLTKINPGTIILTNNSPYLGNTNINGGSLIVDGSIGNSVTFVNSGGLLGGTGTVGSTVFNSGVVSPGHSPGSPGTLNFGSSYVQNADGTLRIEIGGLAAPQHDLLAVGGGVSLDGTLQILRLNNFTPAAGDRVTIITDGAPHIGTFDNVTSDFFGVLRPVPQYDEANDVYVIFQLGSFNIGGLTPNQQAVANNLDDAANDPAAAALINFLQFQPLANLPHAYDLIAPEELASIYEINFSGATVQWLNMQHRMDDIRAGSTGFSANGYSMRDQHGLTVALQDKVVLDAKEPKQSVMTPACDNRWGVFVTGTGEHVTVGEEDFNAHGFDFTTGLVTVGVDYRLTNHFVIGATGTFLHSNADLIDNGDVDASGGKAGLFATYFTGGFYVDLAADGGWNNYDTQRTALVGIATGDTDGAAFNALMAAGYDWNFGCFSIGPTAAFQFSYAGIDGFTETGSLAPLQYPDQDEDAERSALGLRAMCHWKVREHIIIRPEIRAAWKHEFGDNAYPIDSAFASGAGGIFTVHGPKVWRDSALVSSGVNVQWSNCISTSVYYDGEISRANYDNHSLTGAVRIGF